MKTKWRRLMKMAKSTVLFIPIVPFYLVFLTGAVAAYTVVGVAIWFLSNRQRKGATSNEYTPC